MLQRRGAAMFWILTILVIFLSINNEPCAGQTINRAPQFLPGGDMAKFSIPEDTKVGSLVYQLNGIDPEGSDVHYSISGEHLTVDKKTGAVRLLQPLDREELDLLEVIISITDEGIGGSEPNTVSLRREISVLDVNDNPPVFHNRPYTFVVEEKENVGTILYSNVSITDADGGVNADVMLNCSKPMDGDDYCSVFDVRPEKVGEGRFVGIITLAKSIDYEQFSTYNLVLKASDMALDPGKRLTATANVVIEVKDIQDQPPVFLNAPYSATVAEGTEAGASVLTIRAKDGDLGDPRHIVLSLEDDYLAYFALVTQGNSTERDNSVTTAKLVTTNNHLDREHSDILQNGGIYSFTIRATELVNNDTFGDTTTSQVTVVITDIDDQIPSFNQDEFHINLSEDTGVDTPIPGLNLVAYDRDIGDNARYSLKLRDVMNSEGTFKVQPQSAKGHTPVVIKVADVKKLDYDINDPNLRKMIFEVVALVKGTKGEDKEVASSLINIDIIDANDNAPEFSLPSYRLRVPEDVRPGSLISNISATDKDSGLFSQLTYVVKGFGSEKFKTHPTNGGLLIAENSQGLDYENQQSYSLTFEAQDGGKKVSTVNVFIEVDDVNDNAPVFEMKEYSRTVREGATHFEPQLFIRATDADGPDQGGNKIFYSIKSVNAEDIFFIEPVSGELILNSPVRAADTPNGQYELVIRASDAGVPHLYSDVHVVIRVGVPGNQRPRFRGTEDIVNKPLIYTASLKENVKPGTDVLTVVATDPDGQDSLLEYFIAGGAKDNFIMDRKLGKIKVSPYAHLDYESGGSHYDIIVHVVDAGTPVRETATATVAVEILDVNNKPPVFPSNDLSLYTHYLSEQAEIGESVVNVTAFDPDTDALLEYSIIEPIRASDRTGLPLKSTAQHTYKDWFKINSSTGEIRIAQPLYHNVAAVVILTVQAKDLNAKENIETQIAKVEVTVYIQAYSNSNPVFTLHGWSGKNNIIKLKVPEEQPLGTVVFRLTAKDPVNNKLIKRYEKLKHESKKDSEDFFKIGVQSGDVILNKRLDFEQLEQRILSFQVKAFSDDGIRTSVANVVIEVQNINDNSPKFNEQSYNVRILESAQYPQIVLLVHATDQDADDNITFYGRVSYSISGENANLFTIDAVSGVIQVAKYLQLDREKQQTLKFLVIASDTPQGGANQRKTTAMVTVEVLDVNDNAPQFNKNMYSAVVPENVPVGTHVVTVTAVDPDEGLGGEISFDFSNEGEASRLFSLNHTTGNVTTRQALTGKGRTEPYQLMVRAQDKGKPSLSSDVPLVIHIGDVFANDGVPVFIRPKVDEQAYISENSSIGSPVFQVQATDPDDPSTPNGKILFKFLNDKTDSLAFSIDSHSGLITSSQRLDRETKGKYALVIVAQDQGNPPQQATRMLLVHITDIDDHKPIFRRKLDDEPLYFSIPEELDIGTEVGKVEAVDEDLGDNGKIDYLIAFGNEDGLFNIKRSDDNKGIITVAGRVDRETAAEHMLTVKCFKLSTPPFSYRKQYNKQDPSYQQVKIIVEDIDDNKPEFIKGNITIGVRLNVPVDTSLLTLEVVDKDFSTMPVFYNLLSTTFYTLAPSIIDTVPIPTNKSMVFQLDEETGELRTTGSMLSFVDGYFELKVTANNSDIPGREATTAIKIFVLRDRDLLKFVFGKPPTDVRKSLADFTKEVEKALLLPVSLNIYDTQFYAKEDGSLDFSSTSSCFQLVGKESYDLNDMQYLLQDPENTELDHVYAKYGVQGVQHCTPLIAKAEASWIQLWVLAVACFIGLAAFTSGISVCCLYSRYKHQSRRSLLHEAPPVPVSSIGYLSSAMSGPTVVLAAPPLSKTTHMYEWVHDGNVLPSGHDNMSYQSFPVR